MNLIRGKRAVRAYIASIPSDYMSRQEFTAFQTISVDII